MSAFGANRRISEGIDARSTILPVLYPRFGGVIFCRVIAA
jgi:hypothetical protein